MNKNILAEHPPLEKKKVTRYSVAVSGIVQGVGFRPFVYSLAKKNSLQGFVLNNTGGVEIEVEGEAKNIKNFMSQIKISSPPLAIIEKISSRELTPAGYRSFHIKKSKKEKKKLEMDGNEIVSFTVNLAHYLPYPLLFSHHFDLLNFRSDQFLPM